MDLYSLVQSYSARPAAPSVQKGRKKQRTEHAPSPSKKISASVKKTESPRQHKRPPRRQNHPLLEPENFGTYRGGRKTARRGKRRNPGAYGGNRRKRNWQLPPGFKFPETPEEIAAWREERRKNYPTVANIEKKKLAQAEEKAESRRGDKPKRSQTLLQNLVQPDVVKEQMLALQCIDYLCKHNFFGETQDETGAKGTLT